MSDFEIPDDSGSDGEFDVGDTGKKQDAQFLDNVDNFESLGIYDESRMANSHAVKKEPSKGSFVDPAGQYDSRQNFDSNQQFMVNENKYTTNPRA